MKPTISLLLALGLCGCSKPPEDTAEAEAARPVQVVEVRMGSIQRSIVAEGILRAVEQSSVAAKISAPVKQFLVNRGDHVRAGQLLAVLENADLAAAVADTKGSYEQSVAAYRTVSDSSVVEELGKAQSDVDAARQSLEAAQKLFNSREDLFRQGALARRLVDEAAVAQSQAKGAYEIAQRHLESFRSVARQEAVNSAAGQRDSAKGKYDASLAQLSYSEVRSPISGVVADRPAFAGEMATAGTPLLTIMDISRVVARVNVPQAQASFVRVGQQAQMIAADGTGDTTGKVTLVSPAVDPQSTTVEVWIEARNPGEKLRPGGTVRVTILADIITSATLVPPSALFPSQEGGSAVIVVGSDSTTQQHKVDVGIRTTDAVQIVGGVDPGAKVVVEGGLGLGDGTKVAIAQPSAKETDRTRKDAAKE